jgi:hypothetical protein
MIPGFAAVLASVRAPIIPRCRKRRLDVPVSGCFVVDRDGTLRYHERRPGITRERKAWPDVQPGL